MDSKQFIEEYNAAVDKEKYVAKHIVKKYLPYAMKLDLCHRIIDVSMYTTINNAKVFKPDTPVRYLFFVMAIVENYTDIKFNTGSSDDVALGQQNLESLDLLEESGATEVIMTVIGADIQKFNTVLEMMIDDVTDMERSLVPFLDTKIQAWQMSLNALDSALKDKVESDGAIFTNGN